MNEASKVCPDLAVTVSPGRGREVARTLAPTACRNLASLKDCQTVRDHDQL